jgi:hypothetical protein
MEEEDHAPRYPSHTPDVEPYEESYPENGAAHPGAQYPDSYPVAEYQAAQYQGGQYQGGQYQGGQYQTAQYQNGEYLSGHLVRSSYLRRSVPQFLIHRDDIPPPSAYRPALRDHASYYATRILAGALGGIALAALATLASSESARDFIASTKASGVAALSVASMVMQPGSAPSSAAAAEPGQSGPSPAAENAASVPQTIAAESVVSGVGTPAIAGSGSITVAAVAPTRDDIRAAYQGAIQGNPVQLPATPAGTMPTGVIRHLDAGEIASLLKRADALVNSGDLAAARLVLRRAAEAGDARAAMMLGGTYDPKVLDKFGVYGLVPDLAMARSWYEKAKRLGAPQTTQLDLPAKRQD